VQPLTGLSLMALPFYIVYARQELGAPPEAVGWFILSQVLGGVPANLLWVTLAEMTPQERQSFFRMEQQNWRG